MNFVRQCHAHTDGIVIAERFDAAPPAGATSSRTLKAEALQNRVPFLIELATHRLPFVNGHDDVTLRSDAHTLTAGSVSLPLRPADLATDVAAQPLVRAAIRAQTGAARIFAPDFQIAAADDPSLAVNLRCLQLTSVLVGSRPVAAWIRVSLEAMLDGILPYVAERYSSVLPPGAMVVLTVSDLRAALPVDELMVYFLALKAFDAVGLPVVVDRASEVSIAAVTTFATGCMLGTRLYRTAPASPLWTSELNPRIPVSYFEARKGRRLNLDRARAMHTRGNVTRCVHGGCAALQTRSTKLEVRLHSAHDLRAEIRRGRALGAPALVRVWRQSNLKHLQRWAQALDLASAISEEA